MATPAGLTLSFLAVGLLLAAVPNGNPVLAGLALLPLAFLAVGASARPVRLTTRFEAPAGPFRIGERVPVVLHYEARGGMGVLQVAQALPGEFELMEGHNVDLRAKGIGRLRGQIVFAVRCRRRGRFDLAATEWRLTPYLHTGPGASGEVPAEMRMEFRPDLTRFKRMPGGRMLAERFAPHGDEARVGLRTTDFRDIRPYVRGDPPKTINWKITARLASTLPPDQPLQPYVNEYEAEGQRAVWLFLDCGANMHTGNNVENAFESAILAAGSVARFFIDRGFKVGLSLYNRREPQHLYPEYGRRQMLRIERVLHGVEPEPVGDALATAVSQAKGFLHGGRTWVVVITRAETVGDADLDALRRLRNLTARRRKGSRMLVVSPDPYGLVPLSHEAADAVRALQRALDAPRVALVRRLGVRLIHWDPVKRPLHAHLLGAR